MHCHTERVHQLFLSLTLKGTTLESLSFIKLKKHLKKQIGIGKAEIEACVDKESLLALAATKGVGGPVDAHGIASPSKSNAPTASDRLRPPVAAFRLPSTTHGRF